MGAWECAPVEFGVCLAELRGDVTHRDGDMDVSQWHGDEDESRGNGNVPVGPHGDEDVSPGTGLCPAGRGCPLLSPSLRCEVLGVAPGAGPPHTSAAQPPSPLPSSRPSPGGGGGGGGRDAHRGSLRAVAGPGLDPG